MQVYSETSIQFIITSKRPLVLKEHCKEDPGDNLRTSRNFLLLVALSPPAAEASLYRREARGKEKESARGTMGRGKREDRRFSGRICGSVVLAKPVDDYLNDIWRLLWRWWFKRLVYAIWCSFHFVSPIFYASCFWSDCPPSWLVMSSVINCGSPSYKGQKLT